VHDILASYASTAEATEKTRAEDFLRLALAGGPPPKADRWPEGPAGADANAAA
jgi:hypothetical protein